MNYKQKNGTNYLPSKTVGDVKIGSKVIGSIAYPLIAVIGDVGVGKSLYAVDIIRRFYNQFKDKRNIFTNMILFEIPYIPINFEDFTNKKFTELSYKKIINHKTGEIDENGIPEYTEELLEEGIKFRDGLLVIDEVQEGADSYEFFRKDVKRLNKFVSQIRKFDLELFVITQRLSFVAKRLRQLLNYIYFIDYHIYYDKTQRARTFKSGIVKISYTRLSNSARTVYKEEVKNLRHNFPYYLTKQKLNGDFDDE